MHVHTSKHIAKFEMYTLLCTNRINMTPHMQKKYRNSNINKYNNLNVIIVTILRLNIISRSIMKI